MSILLLQPDNSETSVQLLSLIAIRIGAPSDVQPFLNETAGALPPSTTFKAPTNVVAINTLWFTSLVLSLAAALFGILAKQWCREYLRWHSVIASSRENVLIRQVRFEAWERWQVASFIASIPAFLEIALVLFLVGLLVFVPTFSEHSLTTVVSVVIVSMLLGVVVLTVLPTFYRLCPFQTPTGWAVVYAREALRCALMLLVFVLFVSGCLAWHYAVLLLSWFRLVEEPEEPRLRSYQDIRRDLKNTSRMKGQTTWRAYGLITVEDSKTCQAVVEGIEDACIAMNMRDVGAASVDVVQVRILTQALSWVRRGSNNEAVVSAILDASSTIHLPRAESSTYENLHVLSSIHAICPGNLDVVLQQVQWFAHPCATGPQPPVRLWNIVGPFIYVPHDDAVLLPGWESDPIALSVCHAVLRAALVSLVHAWLSSNASSDSRRRITQQILLLFTLLRLIPSGDAFDAVRYCGTDLTRQWAGTMEEIYPLLAPHKNAYIDGLVPLCVVLCRLLGPVTFAGDGGEQCIIGK